MQKLTFLFMFFTLSCVAFVNSDRIENSYTAEGDDPQAYDGLAPTDFRAYSDRENTVEDIVLRFYKGLTVDDYVDYKLPVAVDMLRQPNFHKDETTILYIHGYKETPDKESVHTVVGAYLKKQSKTNVILVDWSNMAAGSYNINAAPNTRKVAHAVAALIKRLIDQGLVWENLHVVGHSLGGQTAGFIGRELQKSNIKLKRISALDPAFPMFYPGFVLSHIRADDAEFVDVIHTDAGFYGAPISTGTVDFWVNGGERYQPGCPTGIHIPMSDEDLCSHWRSWRFWADSVENPTTYMAGKGDKVALMGVGAKPGITGDYRLNTNAELPFGKGEGGIVH